MSEPLRYDPGCEPDTLDTEAVMFQCPNGGFVKWVDYARLKAEVERLTKLCQATSPDGFIHIRDINAAKEGKQP